MLCVYGGGGGSSVVREIGNPIRFRRWNRKRDVSVLREDGISCFRFVSFDEVMRE